MNVLQQVPVQETAKPVCVTSSGLQQLLSTLPMELFYGVVEQSSVGISITDPKANILYCNTAFCRITGYKRGELQYKNHNILASKQTPKARYQAMWHNLIQHQPWTGRLINKRKDGELYLAEVTVTPVIGSEGQITHFLGMHRDISDQFALEQRFHNQKSMIEAVLDAAPNLIAVLDELNQVVLDNLAYKTLRTDLKGLEPFKVMGYLPGISKLEPTHFWPLTIRGRQRWYSVIAQPLFELNEEASLYFGEGKRPCTLLLITDQTERRQQIEQSRLEQLRMQVEEQTLYFAIKDTLDAAIVQSQAPLNMLQAALRLDSAGPAATAIQAALTTGQEVLSRLEFYKPEIRHEDPITFSLIHLVADLHDMQYLRLEHLDVLLHLNLSENLPDLYLPRTRLLTGLNLLFERACEHITNKAVGQIRFTALTEDQELLLEIHDSGDKPMVTSPHQLMKPYLAGGEKYNSVVELGFVQSFVNDYRGVIEVETSDLGGSCLRMRLPLSTVTRRE